MTLYVFLIICLSFCYWCLFSFINRYFLCLLSLSWVYREHKNIFSNLGQLLTICQEREGKENINWILYRMCLKSWQKILSYTGYISCKIKIKTISRSTSFRSLYSVFYSVTSDWKKVISDSCSISKRQSQSLLLFSPSVMFNSLWPHGLHHTRLPCPSPSPSACSNSFPLSQ